MIKISPSILSADFTRIKEELAAVEAGGADYVHVDVMDGNFVPNITVGPFIVEAVKRATKLPLDVHLMIERPENYVADFAKAGSSIITVHVEATKHLNKVLSAIRQAGCKAGVSLNPGTALSTLEPVIRDVDLVLVMSVNPGFSGQSFIESSVERVRTVRRMLVEAGSKAELEVDGGIKADTIGRVAAAGADVFVSGSALFSTKDYAATIRTLKEAAQRAMAKA